MRKPTEVNQSDSHSAVLGARPSRAAVAGVLVFAVFACSGDSASQEPGQVAACDLLTPAEIEQATGLAPNVGDQTTYGLRNTCQWASADGSQARLANVIVAPTRFLSFEEFLANATEELGEELASEIQKVDGFGDFAAWLGTDEYGTLQVFVGERVMHVSTWQSSGRTALENVRTLAEKALTRMPS